MVKKSLANLQLSMVTNDETQGFKMILLSEHCLSHTVVTIITRLLKDGLYSNVGF